MSEIAFNKTVALIISVIVLITLIIYFYYLYSSYKKGSENLGNYTNESMNDISLRMECINKNVFSIEEKVKGSLSQQCDSFESIGCKDIFIENNLPYYNCTIYCSKGGTKYMCLVKYNCRTDEAQLAGSCTTLSG